MIDAAGHGGAPLLIFALSAAGVIITLMAGVTWRLVRDRMAARERAEQLLERRLSAGSEKMGTIESRLDSKVESRDCERYRCDMDARIVSVSQDMRRSTDQIRDSMHAIEQRMEQLHASHEVAIRLLKAGVTIPPVQERG